MQASLEAKETGLPFPSPPNLKCIHCHLAMQILNHTYQKQSQNLASYQLLPFNYNWTMIHLLNIMLQTSAMIKWHHINYLSFTITIKSKCTIFDIWPTSRVSHKESQKSKMWPDQTWWQKSKLTFPPKEKIKGLWPSIYSRDDLGHHWPSWLTWIPSLNYLVNQNIEDWERKKYGNQYVWSIEKSIKKRLRH